MQPRLDDANIEFDFSPVERIAAMSLDPVKIAWLQTKYAKYWKMRNSTPVPETPELDRSYFNRIAELDGKLFMIQELLDDHKTAMKELQEIGQNESTGQENKSEGATQTRADRLVHKIQTS